MDFTLVQLLSLVVLTYGASRMTLRSGRFSATPAGLRLAHLAAFAAICAVDLAVKFASTGFLVVAPFWIAPFQLAWYWLDTRRGRLPASA